VSHENHGKRILPHEFKYPLFLIGLAVIILGDLTATKIGLALSQEIVISALGVLIMFLGIVLE